MGKNGKEWKPARGDRSMAFRCPECLKLTYNSRKTAKTAARDVEQKWGGSVHAYACPYERGWHVGHKPQALRNGSISREDIPFKAFEDWTEG